MCKNPVAISNTRIQHPGTCVSAVCLRRCVRLWMCSGCGSWPPAEGRDLSPGSCTQTLWYPPAASLECGERRKTRTCEVNRCVCSPSYFSASHPLHKPERCHGELRSSSEERVSLNSSVCICRLSVRGRAYQAGHTC